jgi:hypothetical protein
MLISSCQKKGGGDPSNEDALSMLLRNISPYEQRSAAIESSLEEAEAEASAAGSLGALLGARNAGNDVAHGPGPNNDLVRFLLVLPSRVFSGPGQYPPDNFKAYGIVAFPDRATAENVTRRLMICHAYVSNIIHATEEKAPTSSQMVTVWPVESDKLADRLNKTGRDKLCSLAVSGYGLPVSQKAIEAARRPRHGLDGRGPFLLAWSPARQMGAQDALVLVLDLSSANDPETAASYFRQWTASIQEDPSIWDHDNGWSIEGLRRKIRIWADANGAAILQLFGIGEKKNGSD